MKMKEQELPLSYKIPLLIMGITFIVWMSHFDCKKENEINKVGLEDLNLKLTGVVVSVDYGDNFNGCGIIRLRVINSNIQEYDPRGKLKYYFCVIKKGMAEIYTGVPPPFYNIIGDTMIFDTRAKMGGYLKNGEKANYGSISIYNHDSYYEYIQKHTIFK